MGKEYLASGDITRCAVGSLGELLPVVQDRPDDDDEVDCWASKPMHYFSLISLWIRSLCHPRHVF